MPMDLLVDAAMLETMSISDATDLGASCGVLGGSAGGSDVQAVAHEVMDVDKENIEGERSPR